MWNIGDTMAILGVSTALPGIVMLTVLHFMMERRLGRMISRLSVATFPADDMTPFELTMRRTGLALFLGGSAVGVLGALMSRKASGGG